MRFFLSFLFTSLVFLFSRSLFGFDFEFLSAENLPQDTFIYGGQNIETGEMRFGISRMRNGGHHEIMRAMTGVRYPQEGQGKVGGFGFQINSKGQIVVHPMMSWKGAGVTSKSVRRELVPGIRGIVETEVNTVNPMLPKTDEIWAALLHEDYMEGVLNELVRKTGRKIVIDEDIFHSSRFKFNSKKHAGMGPEPVEHIKYDILPRLRNMVERANELRPGPIRRYLGQKVPGSMGGTILGAAVGSIAGETLGPVGGGVAAAGLGAYSGWSQAAQGAGLRGMLGGGASGLVGFGGGFLGAMGGAYAAEYMGIENELGVMAMSQAGGALGAVGSAGLVGGVGGMMGVAGMSAGGGMLMAMGPAAAAAGGALIGYTLYQNNFLYIQNGAEKLGSSQGAVNFYQSMPRWLGGF